MSPLRLLVLLAACQTAVPPPDDGFDLEDLAKLAEAYCEANPEWKCGHVWMCDTPAENKLGLVEVCVLDEVLITDVEAVYGPCVPTPRHPGPCLVVCPPSTGAGCNAYSGCWCPGVTP